MYNEILATDSVDVINEKLKTDLYKNMDNAEIAHKIVETGCDVDFNIYMVKNKQLVHR